MDKFCKQCLEIVSIRFLVKLIVKVPIIVIWKKGKSFKTFKVEIPGL